jgi:SNF2 family DNA or RNA helicase
LIPTAKAKGSLVFVPHKFEETKVLRNLGYAAPAPILHYYNWPGKFTPYDHQRATAAFLTMHRRALVLNDIGTGKTQSALWAADYLMSLGVVKRALVLSPLSTLDRVWGDGIFNSLYGKRYSILHGTAQRRKKLLAEPSDFCIINHDGFEIISSAADGCFDLIIVDEAAVFRNPSTDRYKALRRYLDRNPNVLLWLMTGTPTPNEPTDAWALGKLLQCPGLDTTYTGFRDRVMMKLGKWNFIPRPDSAEIVSKILQPSIRFTRDDCLDLPDTTYMSLRAELSPQQKIYFKEMLKHLVIEAKCGDITAANEAVKAQKLVQIACGAAYDEFGNTVELDCGPRLKVLRECIEMAGGKVIVFAPLTGVLEVLRRELSKTYTVEVVNGAVSANNRSRIFKDFQEAKDPQILIAHPATMAHGLTLTSASSTIWYGPITSNEIYVQANGRTDRIGKTRASTVVHIEATDLEHRIFERLKGKQKLQGVLLDILTDA